MASTSLARCRFGSAGCSFGLFGCCGLWCCRLGRTRPRLMSRRLGSFGSCRSVILCGCCRGGFSGLGGSLCLGLGGRLLRGALSVTRCRTGKLFKVLARFTRYGRFKCGRRSFNVFALVSQVGQQFLAGDSELFGELVDTQFCHFSPCSGTSPNGDVSLILQAAHRWVLIGCPWAFNPLSLLVVRRPVRRRQNFLPQFSPLLISHFY